VFGLVIEWDAAVEEEEEEEVVVVEEEKDIGSDITERGNDEEEDEVQEDEEAHEREQGHATGGVEGRVKEQEAVRTKCVKRVRHGSVGRGLEVTQGLEPREVGKQAAVGRGRVKGRVDQGRGKEGGQACSSSIVDGGKSTGKFALGVGERSEDGGCADRRGLATREDWRGGGGEEGGGEGGEGRAGGGMGGRKGRVDVLWAHTSHRSGCVRVVG